MKIRPCEDSSFQRKTRLPLKTHQRGTVTRIRVVLIDLVTEEEVVYVDAFFVDLMEM